MASVSSKLDAAQIKKTFVGSVDITLNVNLSRFSSQFDKAQRYLDQTVLDDSNKFAPERTGKLKQSGINHTTIGSGVVKWQEPYAHYVYVGMAMAGPPGYKYYTGKPLHIWKSTNPNATKEWFEAAKRANKPIWIRETTRIAGGG